MNYQDLPPNNSETDSQTEEKSIEKPIYIYIKYIYIYNTYIYMIYIIHIYNTYIYIIYIYIYIYIHIPEKRHKIIDNLRLI